MRDSSAILVIVVSVGISACATRPAQEPPLAPMAGVAAGGPERTSPASNLLADYNTGTAPTDGGQGQSQALSKPTFQLERYIGVDSSGWPAPDHQINISDLYTRLELHSDSYRAGTTPPIASSTNGIRDYTQESRGWVPRLLSTETDSVTTLASVQVANPQLNISVPLFSITHASGSGLGNTWGTDFTASDVQSPLFLVGPNTAITIDLSAKVSSDLKSQGTSLAVNAITQAVKIANPSAALLTTLSSSSVNSAATAIDTAISGLLSKDISEDIKLGRFVNSWQPDSKFVFYGCSPFARAETPSVSDVCGMNADIDGGTDVEVGAWTLSLTCPRLSAFDPRDICHPIGTVTPPAKDTIPPKQFTSAKIAIAKEISDSQILQFPLSSQVTVSSFSQSQAWFTTFATAIGHSATASDYSAFCAGAVSAYEANGLSELDAKMALRALIRSLGQFSSVRSKFTSAGDGATCMTYAPPSDGGASFE